MKNRERKIKIINDLLNGKNTKLAEDRPEIEFNLISDNLYKETGRMVRFTPLKIYKP
jgi:hypothetical protein